MTCFLFLYIIFKVVDVFFSMQGVLEAVRISLAGYPTRRTYAEFVDRFGLLVPEAMDGRFCQNFDSFTQLSAKMKLFVAILDSF